MVDKIKSFAKINLALNIIGKSSSLHKIESIIAFIALHDDIFIKKIESQKHDVLFYGKFSKNIGKNNTVSKLLYILEKKKLLKNVKFQIKINKRIPFEAGLGGGSMNAANILKYFLKKKIIKSSKKEIKKICNLIGSDVILGIHSKNLILNSKNQIKYFKNSKKFNTLIVKPFFGSSTKDIYKRVGKFSKPIFNYPSKRMFNFDFLEKTTNQLEPIVFFKYPKLKNIKKYLEKSLKPVFVRMTGSGSALVAYFKSKKKCSIAKRQFVKKYKNFWCIASKTI